MKPKQKRSLPGMRSAGHLRACLDFIGKFLALVWSVLAFPFKLCGAIINTAADWTQGLLRGLIRLCFALIGLTIFFWVGFALVRVLFHPLFV